MNRPLANSIINGFGLITDILTFIGKTMNTRSRAHVQNGNPREVSFGRENLNKQKLPYKWKYLLKINIICMILFENMIFHVFVV